MTTHAEREQYARAYGEPTSLEQVLIDFNENIDNINNVFPQLDEKELSNRGDIFEQVKTGLEQLNIINIDGFPLEGKFYGAFAQYFTVSIADTERTKGVLEENGFIKISNRKGLSDIYSYEEMTEDIDLQVSDLTDEILQSVYLASHRPDHDLKKRVFLIFTNNKTGVGLVALLGMYEIEGDSALARFLEELRERYPRKTSGRRDLKELKLKVKNWFNNSFRY